MKGKNCRPEPFKISFFDLLTHVDSCLELSTPVDRRRSVYGFRRLQLGGKTRIFGCRKGVDGLSIGCR